MKSEDGVAERLLVSQEMPSRAPGVRQGKRGLGVTVGHCKLAQSVQRLHKLLSITLALPVPVTRAETRACVIPFGESRGNSTEGRSR